VRTKGQFCKISFVLKIPVLCEGIVPLVPDVLSSRCTSGFVVGGSLCGDGSSLSPHQKSGRSPGQTSRAPKRCKYCQLYVAFCKCKSMPERVDVQKLELNDQRSARTSVFSKFGGSGHKP
jgi:hypothetical protein